MNKDIACETSVLYGNYHLVPTSYINKRRRCESCQIDEGESVILCFGKRPIRYKVRPTVIAEQKQRRLNRERLGKKKHVGEPPKKEPLWSRVDRSFRDFLDKSLALPRHPRWLLKYSGSATDDVAKFCREHGILADLEHALKRTEKAFPTLDKITVYIEENPEEAHKYVVVKVSIHAEVKAFMTAYKRCISAWSSSLSNKALDYICLGHSVVRP
jgi:hypothetical protein